MATMDDEIARLAIDGYYVRSRTSRLVELERKNSWMTVAFHAVLSGGGPTVFRTERLYITADEHGDATISLHPPLDLESG